jgi:glycosyltransferase involved in cell wall biosynthesis
MPAGSPEFQRQAFFDEFPFLRNKRIVLFLGRIHPKKGCDILIEAFAQIASKDPALHLVIAGPDKDGWRSALEKIVHQSGIYDRVSWTGMLVGDLKWGAFHAADIFILPSHSENFGVAVVEALACGIPVLITDKINIWQEIKNTKCGLVDADSYDGVVRLFENWLQLSASEKREMKKNAKDCFGRFFEMENSAKNFVETLRKFL